MEINAMTVRNEISGRRSCQTQTYSIEKEKGRKAVTAKPREYIVVRVGRSASLQTIPASRNRYTQKRTREFP